MGPPAPTTEFGAALNQHPRMIPTHVRIYQCVTFMDHSLTVQAILLTVAATGTCHWGQNKNCVTENVVEPRSLNGPPHSGTHPSAGKQLPRTAARMRHAGAGRGGGRYPTSPRLRRWSGSQVTGCLALEFPGSIRLKIDLSVQPRNLGLQEQRGSTAQMNLLCSKQCSAGPGFPTPQRSANPELGRLVAPPFHSYTPPVGQSRLRVLRTAGPTLVHHDPTSNRNYQTTARIGKSIEDEKQIIV